jgi:metal-responsive CopG/Arc/MetJ family transcriptional regulator
MVVSKGHRTTVKVLVSLTKPLLLELDKMTELTQRSRSSLLREAIIVLSSIYDPQTKVTTESRKYQQENK